MNDSDLQRMLRLLDGEVELRADRATTIRAEMLAELSRVSGSDLDVVVEHVPDRESSGSARHRVRPVLLVAAAVVLLLGGVLAIRADDPAPAVTDSVPEAPEVGTENYLRACVDFQAATERDGEDWYQVVRRFERDGVDDPTYRATLAAALEDLAFAPRAAPFAADLRRAAADLRSGEPVAPIISLLAQAEQASSLTAGATCLR